MLKRLKKVVNGAKKAFSKDAYQLLPKTPSMKRKRGKNGQSQGFDTISSGDSSLFSDPASSDASPVLGNADHASTFLDNRGANNQNKKLRIDISEIYESTTNDATEQSKREPRKGGKRKVAKAKNKVVRSSKRIRSKNSSETVTVLIRLFKVLFL